MSMHTSVKEEQIESTTGRPLLAQCSVPGCPTLTMGGTCVEHDVPSRLVFPRGRPFPAAAYLTQIFDTTST